MQPKVIECRGLTVEYGAVVAVDQVDLEVNRGEVFGLLGTNGAGKTTTLDVLEGYRSPTAGIARVFGLDPVAARDALAPRLGIMLQDAGFFETLTVAQTVKAWSRFHRGPRDVSDSVEMVGLAHAVGTRVGMLSGGERRRLDLCLALLGHPELLFLDEPTTGMDPEGRHHTLGLIEGLVEEGTTVVLTTHYLEEAERLCDRVAIMHRGAVVRTGSVAQVVGRSGVAHVSLTVTDAVRRALPADVLGVPVHWVIGPDRCRLDWESPDVQRDLAALLAWAGRHGHRLEEIEVRRAGLEDVFLSLGQAGPDHAPFRRGPERSGPALTRVPTFERKGA